MGAQRAKCKQIFVPTGRKAFDYNKYCENRMNNNCTSIPQLNITNSKLNLLHIAFHVKVHFLLEAISKVQKSSLIEILIKQIYKYFISET